MLFVLWSIVNNSCFLAYQLALILVKSVYNINQNSQVNDSRKSHSIAFE